MFYPNIYPKVNCYVLILFYTFQSYQKILIFIFSLCIKERVFFLTFILYIYKLNDLKTKSPSCDI